MKVLTCTLLFIFQIIFIFQTGFSQTSLEIRGTYDIKVTIRGKVFHDIMTIFHVERRAGNYGDRLYFEGFFEVPGVFKSPMSGSFCPGLESFPQCQNYARNFFEASFLAEEGEPFEVYLFTRATSTLEGTFPISLYTDQEKTKQGKFGEGIVTKRGRDE